MLKLKPEAAAPWVEFVGGPLHRILICVTAAGVLKTDWVPGSPGFPKLPGEWTPDLLRIGKDLPDEFLWPCARHTCAPPWRIDTRPEHERYRRVSVLPDRVIYSWRP